MPRIIVYADESSAPALPDAAQQLLQRAGATDVRRSHPELPGVYTAALPEAANARDVIDQLTTLPGIRHAELDQLRSGY